MTACCHRAFASAADVQFATYLLSITFAAEDLKHILSADAKARKTFLCRVTAIAATSRALVARKKI